MAKRLLVAGIDFGTTFTKVVVRDQNSAVDAQVIPGPNGNGLLPSLLYVHDDQIHFLAEKNKDFATLKYLKMLAAHLAENPSLKGQKAIATPPFLNLCRSRPASIVVHDLLTYFLCGVVQEIHTFIRAHSDWRDSAFSNEADPDLLVMQLAVPTGLMSSIGRTEKMFREALIFAQVLAETKEFSRMGGVSYDLLAERVDEQRDNLAKLDTKSQRYSDLTRIYPEVAAGAQTLLQSPNVKDGLYITMDVGGGTIDLNAFRRFSGHHQEFDVPQLDYYSVKVSPLGAERLPGRGTLDPYKTEEKLMEDVYHAICSVLKQAFKKQPNLIGEYGGKKTWDDALIILMGGGADYEPYGETLKRALRSVGIFIADPVRLSTAPDVEVPPFSTFSRFCVANGMSYLSDNLEDFRFPKEIGDFPFLNFIDQNDKPIKRQNKRAEIPVKPKSVVVNNAKNSNQGYICRICPYCGKNNFKNVLGYIAHIRSSHPDKWRKYLTSDEAKEIMNMLYFEKCPVCGIFVKNLNKHMKTKHNSPKK
jgi:hypothetical protein